MSIRQKSFPLLVVVSIVLTLASPLHADLEGMWSANHPELGDLFFRIKSDGSCTYFLEKGTETTIHKGKWEEIPTGILLTYENGATMNVGKLEPGVLDVRMDFAAGHDVSSETAVTTGTLVNSQTIGRMTVNKKEEDEDEDRSGYFGAWESELISGDKIYFMINNDRTAGVTHSFSNPDSVIRHQQVIGFWKKDGEKLQILWNDGSFTLIETNGRRIEQTSFEAGELLENAKGFTSRLIPIRKKDLPIDWHQEFRSNYVSRVPIIVLRKPATIKSFFRGKWSVGIDEESRDNQIIHLKRLNRAWTSRYGGVKGSWYPGSDSVSIYWDNGVRELISPVGNHFMVNSFNPNQPITGRPARITPVFPEDKDKLGFYVNRKTELMDPKLILGRR